MAVEVNALADYDNLYPSNCYVYDTDNTEHSLTIGQRYQVVTGTNNYLYHRDMEAQKPPYSSNQYRHPEYYFWAHKTGDQNHYLRILGTTTVELRMYTKWTDEQLDLAQGILGESWDKETLHLVYAFLSVQNFSPYYKALLQFKWDAHLLAFPIFDRYECISLMAGKLVAYLPLKSDSRPVNNLLGTNSVLLSEKVVGEEIERFNGNAQIKDKVVTNLIKHLAGLHQNDPFAKMDMEDMTAQYREGILKYVPSLGCAQFQIMSSPSSCISPPLGRLSQKINFSHELEDTLLTLTGGDLDKLDLLAEFFARIFCNKVPSKYLWYIHGKSQHFLAWLLRWSGITAKSTIYRPGSGQEDLITYGCYLNTSIQYNQVSLSTDEFAKLNHSALKRYIDGGNVIETDDRYQVDKTFEYYPTVIFALSGDRIDTTKAFKKLPWQEIRVPDGWTAKELSVEDRQWLMTCFVARGLQMIDGMECLTQESKQTGLTQLIRQFADKFCESKPGSFTSGKDFHESFRQYINTLPYSVDLPGSTKLSLAVKECTGWMYDSLKSHTTMGFVGIHLNKDRLNAALAENEAHKEQLQQERTARSFHDYLNEITSLVLWPN